MRKERNPTCRRGERNVFCSEYNDCLDIAITRSWNTWNCCKCPFRFNQAAGRQKLSISRDSIVEYELMVQPMNLDYGLYDHEFDGALADAAVY